MTNCHQTIKVYDEKKTKNTKKQGLFDMSENVKEVVHGK